MTRRTVPTRRRATVAIGVVAAALLGAACGGSENAAETETTAPSTAPTTAPSTEASTEPSTAARNGIRVVEPAAGASILEDPPPGLVVLDVRTEEEFDEGHLAGATLIDFYAPDFADRLAELDPTVPYLLYCRSGNRSGQARELMAQLGFTDVADVDGGIVAWAGAGLPIEP